MKEKETDGNWQGKTHTIEGKQAPGKSKQEQAEDLIKGKLGAPAIRLEKKKKQ